MKLSGECANFEIETGQVAIIANIVYPFVITNTVNMRTVLGDMYNKYNKFYIVFNSYAGFTGSNTISYTTLNTTGTGAFIWTLGMSGDLRFISNTVNGQITSVGYFPLRFTLPINGYGFLNGTTTNGLVFERPNNETVTITLHKRFSWRH